MTTYAGQGTTAAEAGPDTFESSGSSAEVTIEKFSIVDFLELGDVVEVTYNSQSYSGVYAGTDGSSFVIYVSDAPDPTNPYLIVGPAPVPAGVTTTITTDVFVVCFLAGTMISTPEGEAAIETLKPGDLVMTSDGSTKPVRWLARQTISTVFADPLKVMPVRIAAGSLGSNLPARDLFVSNDHALEFGGLLVQAGALVNGVTILRHKPEEIRFTYYHIELEDHALVLAEGVPAETFVNNVTRRRFDNYAEFVALYGESSDTIAEIDVPRVKSARQLPATIRARIAAQMPLKIVAA
ncbi:Hint domain-containing protein [Ancylobacter sonchi]|uniref:Hint domain-containing protein n=1 Tax=Ancylobacter sonchi TaxID=1937790 RepID=UPI001BD6226C|nr:Hint domain-containing protein [Ancylobacter sonchi]MBS7536736.1 Hint domain-containing protein [Ancylobacter sonchi]